MQEQHLQKEHNEFPEQYVARTNQDQQDKIKQQSNHMGNQFGNQIDQVNLINTHEQNRAKNGNISMKVRNRRFKKLQQLRQKGYFSQQQIKLRHPLLYYLYVGQYDYLDTRSLQNSQSNQHKNEQTRMGLSLFLQKNLMNLQYKQLLKEQLNDNTSRMLEMQKQLNEQQIQQIKRIFNSNNNTKKNSLKHNNINIANLKQNSLLNAENNINCHTKCNNCNDVQDSNLANVKGDKQQLHKRFKDKHEFCLDQQSRRQCNQDHQIQQQSKQKTQKGKQQKIQGMQLESSDNTRYNQQKIQQLSEQLVKYQPSQYEIQELRNNLNTNLQNRSNQQLLSPDLTHQLYQKITGHYKIKKNPQNISSLSQISQTLHTHKKLTVQQQSIQQQHLIEHCQQLFLQGKLIGNQYSNQINYQQIDQNQLYDDLKVINQDQQEMYFQQVQAQIQPGQQQYYTGIQDF